jgi:fucose permease
MFSHLDAAKRRLYVVLCANFVVLGISMTIFGATVPQIIRGFGWSYLETGLVQAAGSVGGLVSGFVSGLLLKRASQRLMIAVGLGVTAVALCLIVRAPDPWLNCLINFAIGIGAGFSEVVTNSLVIRLERPGESRLMNLMHAFFCVGAVVGPLMVGGLTALKVDFVQVFLVAGIIQAVVGLLLLAQSFPELRTVPPANLGEEMGSEVAETGAGSADLAAALPADAHGLRALLSHPLLLVAAAALFLYVGVELSMSNWIAEYFVKFRDAGAAAAALMVSVYWMGLLVGRLGLSFFYKGKRQEYMLALLAVASVACFAAVVLLPLPPLAVGAAFLTGLAFSGIYPMVVSLVGLWFQGSTTAVGICTTAGGVGVLVFPLAIAALAQTWGLDRALLASTAFDFLLAVIAGGLAWRRWRGERRLKHLPTMN